MRILQFVVVVVVHVVVCVLYNVEHYTTIYICCCCPMYRALLCMLIIFCLFLSALLGACVAIFGESLFCSVRRVRVDEATGLPVVDK